MVEITLFGVPVPKGRPKFSVRETGTGRFVQVHTPGPTRAYERRIAVAGQVELGSSPPFDPGSPLTVICEAHLPVPASWSGRKAQRALDGLILPTGRPDVDNLAKSPLDALNGIVWPDDNQIVSLLGIKRYSDTPRLVVRTREWKPRPGACPCCGHALEDDDRSWTLL